MLEYILPENGNPYCIFLSHKNMRIIRLGPAAQISALARTFVDDLTKSKPWKENSQALYDAVLMPIPNIDQFNRLTIVPDGDLHLVPFDALSSPSGKLLGETAVTAYAPSVVSDFLLKARRSSQAPDVFLGVGGAIYNQAGMQPFALAKAKTRGGYLGVDPAKLPNLPESGNEVESAAKLLHAPPELRTLQVGKDATELPLFMRR